MPHCTVPPTIDTPWEWPHTTIAPHPIHTRQHCFACLYTYCTHTCTCFFAHTPNTHTSDVNTHTVYHLQTIPNRLFYLSVYLCLGSCRPVLNPAHVLRFPSVVRALQHGRVLSGVVALNACAVNPAAHAPHAPLHHHTFHATFSSHPLPPYPPSHLALAYSYPHVCHTPYCALHYSLLHEHHSSTAPPSLYTAFHLDPTFPLFLCHTTHTHTSLTHCPPTPPSHLPYLLPMVTLPALPRSPPAGLRCGLFLLHSLGCWIFLVWDYHPSSHSSSDRTLDCLPTLKLPGFATPVPASKLLRTRCCVLLCALKAWQAGGTLQFSVARCPGGRAGGPSRGICSRRSPLQLLRAARWQERRAESSGRTRGSKHIDIEAGNIHVGTAGRNSNLAHHVGRLLTLTWGRANHLSRAGRPHTFCLFTTLTAAGLLPTTHPHPHTHPAHPHPPHTPPHTFPAHHHTPPLRGLPPPPLLSFQKEEAGRLDKF